MAYGLTNAKGASGSSVIKPVFSAVKESTYFESFTADKDYSSLLFIYINSNTPNSCSINTAISKKSATIYEETGLGFIGIYRVDNVTNGTTITPPKLNDGYSGTITYTCVIEISSSIKTDTTELSSYTFSSSYNKILAVRVATSREEYSTSNAIPNLELVNRGKASVEEITGNTIVNSFVYAKHSGYRAYGGSYIKGTSVVCDALFNVSASDILSLVGSCKLFIFKLP